MRGRCSDEGWDAHGVSDRAFGSAERGLPSGALRGSSDGALRGRTFFSGEALVATMCDRTEPQLSDPEKKVFEPGCGTGNFLVEILRRRLLVISGEESRVADGGEAGRGVRTGFEVGAAAQHQALVALSNLYGVDCAPEYVADAKHRMKKVLSQHFSLAENFDYRFWPYVELFLEKNIIVGDLLGDLDEIQFVNWQSEGEFRFRADDSDGAAEVDARRVARASRAGGC